MKIDYYDIKSERQENGIWGSPIRLIEMEGTPKVVDLELHSAIIVALDEIHKTKFKILSQSDVSCLIYFVSDIFNYKIIKNMYVVKYDNFMLDGNRLYFIRNIKERRFLKMNNIKNENI
jgi:hypothetical protein